MGYESQAIIARLSRFWLPTAQNLAEIEQAHA